MSLCENTKSMVSVPDIPCFISQPQELMFIFIYLTGDLSNKEIFLYSRDLLYCRAIILNKKLKKWL